MMLKGAIRIDQYASKLHVFVYAYEADELWITDDRLYWIALKAMCQTT